MLQWFIKTSKLIREIRKKTIDVLRHLDQGDVSKAEVAKEYLKTDFSYLKSHWETEFPSGAQGLDHGLGRHIYWGADPKHGGKHDYYAILSVDLPELEKQAEEHLLKAKGPLWPEAVLE